MQNPKNKFAQSMEEAKERGSQEQNTGGDGNAHFQINNILHVFGGLIWEHDHWDLPKENRC